MVKLGRWKRPPEQIKGNLDEDGLIAQAIKDESRRGDIMSEAAQREQAAAKDMEGIVTTRVDRERAQKG